ncbi:MAG: hypothetical protein AB8G96_00345 [Phycisphaerales bacterium]
MTHRPIAAATLAFASMSLGLLPLGGAADASPFATMMPMATAAPAATHATMSTAAYASTATATTAFAATPSTLGQVRVNRPLAAPIAGVTRPGFSRRDRPLFVSGLELDELQEAVLDVALARYEQGFQAAVAEYRAAVTANRPAASSPSLAYTQTQEAMRRRMRAVIDTARAAAADAATEAEAAQIRADAMAEVEELRGMLADRLAEFGPEAEARAAVDDAMRAMRARAVGLDRTRHALGQTLLGAVRDSLSPSQQEQWPAFDRALVRRSMGEGRLAGESLDLARLLVETVPNAEDRAPATPAVEAWSIDVDARLRLRNRRATELAVALADAELADDQAAAAETRREQVALHQSIRDANIRGMTAIAAALPDDQAAAFLAEAQRRSFPSVDRALPEERIFTAALEAVADEEALVEAILAIVDEYDVARDAIDGRLRQLTLDEEPQQMRSPAAVSGPSELPPSRLAAAFRDRNSLGQRSVASIRGLLGDERFSALPGARRWLRR